MVAITYPAVHRRSTPARIVLPKSSPLAKPRSEVELPTNIAAMSFPTDDPALRTRYCHRLVYLLQSVNASNNPNVPQASPLTGYCSWRARIDKKAVCATRRQERVRMGRVYGKEMAGKHTCENNRTAARGEPCMWVWLGGFTRARW